MDPRREVPPKCKCWPYWTGERYADATVCADFQPNHDDDIFGFPRCATCKHLGICHRRPDPDG